MQYFHSFQFPPSNSHALIDFHETRALPQKSHGTYWTHGNSRYRLISKMHPFQALLSTPNLKLVFLFYYKNSRKCSLPCRGIAPLSYETCTSKIIVYSVEKMRYVRTVLPVRPTSRQIFCLSFTEPSRSTLCRYQGTPALPYGQ